MQYWTIAADSFRVLTLTESDLCPTGSVGCDGSGFATYGVNDLIDCCGGMNTDGLTVCSPDCGTGVDECVPDGVLSACDGTDGDSYFYGFAGGNSYTTDTCATDDSLSGRD